MTGRAHAAMHRCSRWPLCIRQPAGRITRVGTLQGVGLNNKEKQPGSGQDHDEGHTIIYSPGEEGTRIVQAPVGEVQPALVEVQGDAPGRVYRLQRGRTLLGRDPACAIVVDQRAASRRHAEIRRGDDGIEIEDLSSTNGTRLNGRSIAGPMPLADGHLIKIGSVVFQYVDKLHDVEMLEALFDTGTIDPLTGAMNKAHLLRTLNASMHVARSGPPLSLVAIDIDHFKSVNDRHGHLCGDFILKEVCRVIRHAVRPEDMLGRFGGEEFLILMPDTVLDAAVTAAERVRQAVAAHRFEFAATHVPLTISLGVCAFAPDFAKPEDMIAAADAQLYRSKREGRNRVSAGTR